MSDTEELAAIVARMDETAKLTVQVAKALAVELNVQRELAAADRVQIARLLVLVQRLVGAVDLNSLGTERLEQTSVHVAEDLAASIERADAAPSDTPGAGADAALRSPGTAAEAALHPAP